MDKKRTVNIGILQFDISTGDIAANLNTVRKGIHRLGQRGADLVLLPEMWSCGFDLPNLARHAAKTPEILDMLAGMAMEHDMVIAGSLPESANGRVYNSMYVTAGSGPLSPPYRKIHLFPPTNEDRHFFAGEKAVSCATDMGELGMMICYDLRFPELCRILAASGACIILVSAQWPSRRIHHFDALLRARAIENQVFVVASNRCGRENDIKFPGHSQVISPLGDVLCFLDGNDGNVSEGFVTIDLNEITASRKFFNTVRERRLTLEAPALPGQEQEA